MGFREKIIFFGVIPWILVILITVFLVLPTIQGLFEKTSALSEKELELQTTISKIKDAKNVKKVEDEISGLQEDLKGFNKQFPKNDDLETFYADLQKALDASQVVLLKMNISKEKAIKFPKDFFESIDESDKKDSKKSSKKKKKKRKKKTPDPLTIIQRNFKLNVVGDYENILDILYYLQTYYRFVNLEFIAIKEYKGSKLVDLSDVYQKPLNVTFTFNVYKYQKNIIIEETKKTKKKKK